MVWIGKSWEQADQVHKEGCGSRRVMQGQGEQLKVKGRGHCRVYKCVTKIQNFKVDPPFRGMLVTIFS